MNKKSRWQGVKSVWGVVVVCSVILGIISSILQISGVVDFWTLLILPIHTFLLVSIPLYYSVLFVVLCFVAYSAIRRIKRGIRGRKSILDLEDGKKLALLCQTPRTTDFLRQQYDIWESQSSVVVLGGYNFDDYMKRLEKEGFLEYVDGEWQVTVKALEYIRKYHGR